MHPSLQSSARLDRPKNRRWRHPGGAVPRPEDTPKEPSAHRLHDRRRGIGVLGITVWALLALGLYSGAKFFPVVLTKDRIERRVVSSVQNMAHDSTEEKMRLRIVTKGSSASIKLLEENVHVVRESEHGKRIFHIDVTHPSTVRYLGSDRTVTSRIQFTHVIVVDEVALARQKEYERVRREEYEAQQARARAPRINRPNS